MRVLIVDDSALVRERLAVRIAEIPGVRFVEQAADGDVALSAIERTAPDVVVLDIKLPRVSGFEVLSTLNSRGSSLAVIVLTNHPEYRKHALHQGAAYFFDKATQIDALCAQLHAMAAERKVAI